MSCSLLCRLLLFGVTSAAVAADESPMFLKKTAQGCEHEPSKMSFAVPKGWQAAAPQTQGYNSFIGLRLPHPEAEGKPGIEATLFWSPLNVTLEEAVNLEHTLLSQTYGKEKAGKPEPVKAGDKTGSKIVVAEGPTRNGKEIGVVYLFEAGSGDSRWKIKLRATIPRMTQEEGLKAVEELLAGLKW